MRLFSLKFSLTLLFAIILYWPSASFSASSNSDDSFSNIDDDYELIDVPLDDDVGPFELIDERASAEELATANNPQTTILSNIGSALLSMPSFLIRRSLAPVSSLLLLKFYGTPAFFTSLFVIFKKNGLSIKQSCVLAGFISMYMSTHPAFAIANVSASQGLFLQLVSAVRSLMASPYLPEIKKAILMLAQFQLMQSSGTASSISALAKIQN